MSVSLGLGDLVVLNDLNNLFVIQAQNLTVRNFLGNLVVIVRDGNLT